MQFWNVFAGKRPKEDQTPKPERPQIKQENQKMKKREDRLMRKQVECFTDSQEIVGGLFGPNEWNSET